MPLIQYLRWKWANLLNRMDDRLRLRQMQELDHVRNEYQICKRKLDSKCEALLILTKELDGCRRERDQLRLIIEQQRYRQGNAKMFIPTSPTRQSIDHVMRSQALQVEVDDLKQKLRDADGDIKLLREQIARQRMGTSEEGMNMRHFPAHEREELVTKLEDMQEKVLVAERDVQQVLDEKEDLETERDAYKTKYERLNRELNYILKGDENRILDIDALSMENKYLQERLKQMEEEKCIAMATVTKYKSLLERRKNKGILKMGSVQGGKTPGGLIVSQKQVHEVLEQAAQMPPTMKTVMDLVSLSRGLMDSINDKNLALSHQRKTNKILGNRVAELEKKLRTLEVGGLWNVTELSASFDRLRSEFVNGSCDLNRDSSVNGQNGDDKVVEDDRDDGAEVKTLVGASGDSHQASEDSMSNLGTSELSSLTSSPSHEPSLSSSVDGPQYNAKSQGTTATADDGGDDKVNGREEHEDDKILKESLPLAIKSNKDLEHLSAHESDMPKVKATDVHKSSPECFKERLEGQLSLVGVSTKSCSSLSGEQDQRENSSLQLEAEPQTPSNVKVFSKTSLYQTGKPAIDGTAQQDETKKEMDEGSDVSEEEDQIKGHSELIQKGYMPVSQEDFQDEDSYQESDEDEEEDDYDGDADISDSDLHLQVSPPGDSDVQALSAELHGLIEAIRSKVHDSAPADTLEEEEEDLEDEKTEKEENIQSSLFHRDDIRMLERDRPSEC
ncbi:coiled-coil domain-containing protein 149 [Lingula anatina]|uniref:Coiled-coil domain-containing protein 149 n=1 Tax=Lingula anatina TaxID=7574 RepID=A0A1S3IVV7_LINAN|nr:coiled-coil domain-containing protein 149 [Lingula anatina]|eukprot:XP_013402327.1 coiled-coil domain-containing protein 149 [Lingula anatina]